MQKRQNKHPDPTPWLFLAPSLCGVTLFVLAPFVETVRPVSYTHLRAHETRSNLVCRLLLE